MAGRAPTPATSCRGGEVKYRSSSWRRFQHRVRYMEAADRGGRSPPPIRRPRCRQNLSKEAADRGGRRDYNHGTDQEHGHGLMAWERIGHPGSRRQLEATRAARGRGRRRGGGRGYACGHRLPRRRDWVIQISLLPRLNDMLCFFSLQGYEERALLWAVAASFRQVIWLIFAMWTDGMICT